MFRETNKNLIGKISDIMYGSGYSPTVLKTTFR